MQSDISYLYNHLPYPDSPFTPLEQIHIRLFVCAAQINPKTVDLFKAMNLFFTRVDQQNSTALLLKQTYLETGKSLYQILTNLSLQTRDNKLLDMLPVFRTLLNVLESDSLEKEAKSQNTFSTMSTSSPSEICTDLATFCEVAWSMSPVKCKENTPTLYELASAVLKSLQGGKSSVVEPKVVSDLSANSQQFRKHLRTFLPLADAIEEACSFLHTVELIQKLVENSKS